jgi:nucleoside-diphosphate-sugar epimerase
MNIFITGASGYIGRHVAEKLQAAGHHIVGLARSERAVQFLQERGITAHRGDLFDAASLTQAALLSDGVIHLGAAVGPAWAEGDRIAVQALLSTLGGSGKPFVYTSGTPIYGETGLRVVDEDAPVNPPPFFAWRPHIEQQVLAAAAWDVRSIILRPATIFGRGGGSSLLLLLRQAQQERIAQYIGTGENRWSTVHADDLAELYVLAFERAPTGSVFNAAAGASTSMKDLATAISFAIGRERAVASWTLEQARVALGPRADFFAINQQVSGAKATLSLGWNPQAPSLLYDVAYGSYRTAQSRTGAQRTNDGESGITSGTPRSWAMHWRTDRASGFWPAHTPSVGDFWFSRATGLVHSGH